MKLTNSIYLAAKSTRLSSDTDNETDRLLGTQRNDQLQKLNNDLGLGALDIPPVNNFNKQNTNSREGKYFQHLRHHSAFYQ